MTTRNINKKLHEKVLNLSLQLLDAMKDCGVDDRLCLNISPKDDYVQFFILTDKDENGNNEYILEHSQWSEDNKTVILEDDGDGN